MQTYRTIYEKIKIDKLERKMLIEKESCDTDRRVIYAVITETGNDFMQQIFPKHQHLIDELFNYLNKMEKQKALALIKKAVIKLQVVNFLSIISN